MKKRSQVQAAKRRALVALIQEAIEENQIIGLNKPYDIAVHAAVKIQGRFQVRLKPETREDTLKKYGRF